MIVCEKQQHIQLVSMKKPDLAYARYILSTIYMIERQRIIFTAPFIYDYGGVLHRSF